MGGRQLANAAAGPVQATMLRAPCNGGKCKPALPEPEHFSGSWPTNLPHFGGGELQIVDNLQVPTSNRKMLKSPVLDRPAPSPRAAPAPRPARRGRPAPQGADAIALVQSSSLPALVDKELERMILAGDLPAGGKLNESSVAGPLGASRGPGRREAQGIVGGGPPWRVARPRARSLPGARGIGSRPPREESRRLCPP